ncbi:hypothetical protein CMEL01_05143 [Colletotrichum melonis]|uniref:Protein kinase domain-containing protein n=1 Tax=Colletotrichum melonis TaxID=1209925 RepID=A0AAI9U824_9PEZI|nr:hypothetical protein CMEL01_05143 [Colletotrichum melonis]
MENNTDALQKRARRERQLLRMCDGLPAIQVRPKPDLDSPFHRPFFLASRVRKLWEHQGNLGDVLFNLEMQQLSSIWKHSLLFVTFLAYIEVPSSFYAHISNLLFKDGDDTTPRYRDTEMPYSEADLEALGLSRGKTARWEEQYLFTPATIILNPQAAPSIQVIPNSLTRIPFMECDPGQEHGGYGDVKFFKLVPEYVVDEDPSPRSWVPEHQRQPLVVAVKSFHNHDDGVAEADNMRLLRQGKAGDHSISLCNAVVEHGSSGGFSSSRLLIFFPRAELGDLGQFLHGGQHGDGDVVRSYDFKERFPHAHAHGWGNSELARALLHQCVKLASALLFLHSGFPASSESGEMWVRCAHMDLKPNNIIIFGGDGAVGRWKLCGFGISVLKNEASQGRAADDHHNSYYSQGTFNTNARRGRGQYQAPEVPEFWVPYLAESARSGGTDTGTGTAAFVGRVGRSADIWSFGCIFAEVLAFALGGPRNVEGFLAARRQVFNNIRDGNFHSPSNSNSTSTSTSLSSHMVRPQVLQWLDEQCATATPPVWANCWAGHVTRILRVDPRERPDAQALERQVHHVWDDALKCPREATSKCQAFRYEPEPQNVSESPLDKELAAVRKASSLPPSLSLTYPPVPAPATETATPSNVSFEVPVSSNPHFTGLEKIIAEMENFLSEDGHYATQQKRLVLTGLGGVGKTQIATAFAYDAYNAGRYATVLWVFAVDEQEIIKSLTQLTKTLGLVPKITTSHEDRGQQDMPLMALALLQWLSREEEQESRRWLLVFDNVDDLDNLDVSRFFPRVPWGHILITSRRKEARRLGHQVEVGMMEEEEAVTLLKNCSGRRGDDEEEAARHVAHKLGYLPLALDQAGAYITGQSIDFAEYMDLYRVSHDQLLRHKPPRAVWSYEQTVFTTWEISFHAVATRNPVAARLLDLAAFFYSDGAPFALMCELVQIRGPELQQRLLLRDFVDFVQTPADYDRLVGQVPPELMVPHLQVVEAIGTLASFSLVDQKTMSTHPLVHYWLRERQSSADRIKSGRAAIFLVMRAIVNAYDASRFAEGEALYPYLCICLENLYDTPELLSDTELNKIGACMIALDAWVPVSLDHGTLYRADRFFNLVAAHSEHADWRIPDGLLAVRRAFRLMDMGRRRECSDHCARYLATFHHGSRLDKMYASSLAQTCAPCFFRLGDYDRAEQIYKYLDDSLDDSGAMLARKQLVLGAIKIDRGLPGEAAAVLEGCARELQRGIGQNHFLLRVWHQLMARSRLAQRRPAEAEAQVMKGLAVRMNMLEGGKLEFTFSDYELAEVYSQALRAQRRFREAKAWMIALLEKTASEKPRPARSLAELSLIIIEIDEATALFGGGQEERRGIHGLMTRAERKFVEAAAVYELEWNRGMWSFKHFHQTLAEFQERLV